MAISIAYYYRVIIFLQIVKKVKTTEVAQIYLHLFNVFILYFN